MVSTLESVTCHHRWSPCKFGGVMACCADNVMNLQLMPTLYNDHCQGLIKPLKEPLPLYQLASHFLVAISSIYDKAANLVWGRETSPHQKSGTRQHHICPIADLAECEEWKPPAPASWSSVVQRTTAAVAGAHVNWHHHVVPYVSPVAVFATRIKVESSNQCPFYELIKRSRWLLSCKYH